MFLELLGPEGSEKTPWHGKGRSGRLVCIDKVKFRGGERDGRSETMLARDGLSRLKSSPLFSSRQTSGLIQAVARTRALISNLR